MSITTVIVKRTNLLKTSFAILFKGRTSLNRLVTNTFLVPKNLAASRFKTFAKKSFAFELTYYYLRSEVNDFAPQFWLKATFKRLLEKTKARRNSLLPISFQPEQRTWITNAAAILAALFSFWTKLWTV